MPQRLLMLSDKHIYCGSKYATTLLLEKRSQKINRLH